MDHHKYVIFYCMPWMGVDERGDARFNVWSSTNDRQAAIDEYITLKLWGIRCHLGARKEKRCTGCR